MNRHGLVANSLAWQNTALWPKPECNVIRQVRGFQRHLEAMQGKRGKLLDHLPTHKPTPLADEFLRSCLFAWFIPNPADLTTEDTEITEDE